MNIAGGLATAAASSSQPTNIPPAVADDERPVAGPSKPAKTKTRSRTGCMTCRRRKHKCGEERLGPASRPSCERCRSAGLECVWPTADQMPKGRAPRPYRPKRERGPAGSTGPGWGGSSLGGPEGEASSWLPQVGNPTLAAPPIFASPQAGGDSALSFDLAAGALDHNSIAAAIVPPLLLSDQSQASVSTADWPPQTSAESLVGAATYAQLGRSLDLTSSGAAPFDQARVWDLGQAEDEPPPTVFDGFAFGPDATAGPPGIPPPLPPPSPGSAWLFDLPPSPLLLLNSPVFRASSDADPQSIFGFGNSSLGAPSDDDQLAFWRGPDGHLRSGEQVGNWQQGSTVLPRYVTPTPMLEILFKNPEERSLIQHFLFQIPVVFIGRPQSARGTLAVPPAFLAGNEQPDMRSMMPYLDVGQFLALPRGTSTAGDALSLAVMSVAAGHLSHLHHTAGLQALLAADDAAVARSATSEAKYRAVGRSMSKASLSLARSSLDLAQLSQPNGVAVDHDAGSSDEDVIARIEDMTRLLVACSFTILNDCISGGHEHQEGLSLAREVIGCSGGARRMLSALAMSIALTSSQASPLAATRRRRLRLLRSVLEELTSWDLVTSLTTGTAPTSFAAAPSAPVAIASAAGGVATPSESLQDWLFAFAPPSGSHDMSGIDWETVETSWGTSRAVMELFARVNALCSVARSTSTSAPKETIVGATQALVEIGVRKADILRSYPELSRSPFPPFDAPSSTLEPAEDYRRRVKFGKLGVRDGTDSFVDQRRARRLEFGDLLWCMTFEIMLRTDVQGEDPASPQLQALAERIIDLVIESHVRRQVQVGLAWPTVIAGSTLRDPASRVRVHSALDSFRAYTLFELDHAMQLLTEIWALRDAGDEQTTWRDIAARKGGFALV